MARPLQESWNIKVAYVPHADERLLGHRGVGTGDQETDIAVGGFREMAAAVVEPPRGHGRSELS